MRNMHKGAPRQVGLLPTLGLAFLGITGVALLMLFLLSTASLIGMVRTLFGKGLAN